MADRYWVGNGGNWSDDTNHWATSSGGTPGAGNKPGTGDRGVVDASSGTGTITVDETIDVDEIDCLSSQSMSFDQNGYAMTASEFRFYSDGTGSLTLDASITCDGASRVAVVTDQWASEDTSNVDLTISANVSVNWQPDIKSLTVDNGANMSLGSYDLHVQGSSDLVTFVNGGSINLSKHIYIEPTASIAATKITAGSPSMYGSKRVFILPQSAGLSIDIAGMPYPWVDIRTDSGITSTTIRQTGNVTITQNLAFLSQSYGIINYYTDNYNLTAANLYIQGNNAAAYPVLNCGSSTIDLSNYVFSEVNDYSVINFGTSTWFVGGDFDLTTNTTVNGADTCTKIEFDGTAACSLTSGGQTLPPIVIKKTGSGFTFSDSATIESLTVDATNNQAVSWSGQVLTSNGNVNIGGTGTLNMGNGLTISDDGTFTLGASIGSITSASCVFTLQGDNAIVLNQALTVSRLLTKTPNKTITWTAASGNKLTISSYTADDVGGTSGNLVTWVSSSPSTQYYIDAPASMEVSYLSVTDCNNTDTGNEPVAGNGTNVDGGNNTNWDFDTHYYHSTDTVEITTKTHTFIKYMPAFNHTTGIIEATTKTHTTSIGIAVTHTTSTVEAATKNHTVNYKIKYWVGNGGNWSDDTNHWAIVSGGTPISGNKPDANSITIIDANSGTGTITVDEVIDVDEIDCQATHSMSFDQNGYAMTASQFQFNSDGTGSLTLDASITCDGAAANLCFVSNSWASEDTSDVDLTIKTNIYVQCYPTIKSLTVDDGADMRIQTWNLHIQGSSDLVTFVNGGSIYHHGRNLYLEPTASTAATKITAGSPSIYGATKRLFIVPQSSGLSIDIAGMPYQWIDIRTDSGITSTTIRQTGNVTITENLAFLCQSYGIINYYTDNYNLTAANLYFDGQTGSTYPVLNCGSSTIDLSNYVTFDPVRPYHTINFDTSTWFVGGDFDLSTNATVNGADTCTKIEFDGTAACSLTSGGQTLPPIVIKKTGGGFTFSDSATMQSLTVDAANDQAVSWSGQSIISNGNVNIGGTGTLNMGNGLTISDDGTFTLGASVGSITSASCVFTLQGDNAIVLNQALTVSRLLTKTPNKTITWTAASGNKLTISSYTDSDVGGTSGNLVTWVSSSPSTQYYIDAPASMEVSYLSVTDCNNTDTGNEPVAGNGTNVNGGNNTNWNFDPYYNHTTGTAEATTKTHTLSTDTVITHTTGTVATTLKTHTVTYLFNHTKSSAIISTGTHAIIVDAIVINHTTNIIEMLSQTHTVSIISPSSEVFNPRSGVVPNGRDEISIGSFNNFANPEEDRYI